MNVSKSMKRESSELEFSHLIELDIEEVRTKISSSGKYEQDGVSLKKWENAEDGNESFCGTLSRDNAKYIGVLNHLLKRNNRGINHYENGDIYFGQFLGDTRDGHGAYFFSPIISNGFITSETYYGFWRDNEKSKRGIYIWLKEKQSNSTSLEKLFELSDYDAYIGNFENDSYTRGCYLTKIGDSYYVYYGSFSRDGRKDDKKAFFYDNVKNRLFYGTIENDRFTKGYMISFEESDIKNLYYIELDSNDVPLKLITGDKIDEGEKAKVEEGAKVFRDYLMTDNFFMNVFRTVKNVRKFSDENMNDVGMVDSEDGFLKIMDVCSDHNSVVMFKKLEVLMEKYVENDA